MATQYLMGYVSHLVIETANPYAKKLKKQVTIRLDEDTIAYFKNLAEEKDLPYQSLINLYLRDCAQSHKDLKIEWQ
ncbi:BrnA antitoxin family protein [Chromohalobacter sp. 296-RDG]|uniref:BrnA antitoxin family protein n=1 Tax=Chromohalobacter sp. 296-RDG TaxID=2994062 RepID=UPI0024698331|nr:BrnA antitoxin family protein [Chromohalobacter sp. 296-RDG]